MALARPEPDPSLPWSTSSHSVLLFLAPSLHFYFCQGTNKTEEGGDEPGRSSPSLLIPTLRTAVDDPPFSRNLKPSWSDSDLGYIALPAKKKESITVFFSVTVYGTCSASESFCYFVSILGSGGGPKGEETYWKKSSRFLPSSPPPPFSVSFRLRERSEGAKDDAEERALSLASPSLQTTKKFWKWERREREKRGSRRQPSDLTPS